MQNSCRRQNPTFLTLAYFRMKIRKVLFILQKIMMFSFENHHVTPLLHLLIAVFFNNSAISRAITIKNPTGLQAGSEGLQRRTLGQAPVFAGVSVMAQIVLSEELPPQRAR